MQCQPDNSMSRPGSRLSPAHPELTLLEPAREYWLFVDLALLDAEARRTQEPLVGMPFQQPLLAPVTLQALGFLAAVQIPAGPMSSPTCRSHPHNQLHPQTWHLWL